MQGIEINTHRKNENGSWFRLWKLETQGEKVARKNGTKKRGGRRNTKDLKVGKVSGAGEKDFA